MSKLNLDIKLKHVRDYERAHGSLSNIMRDGSVVNVCDFLSTMGKSDDEVENLLKEYGSDEIMFSVMEDLQTAGFLSRSLNMSNMRVEAERAYQQANEQVSQLSQKPTAQ